MRILIIRHGDPDYENDSLTELGHRQAESLSEVLKDYPIKRICSSPFGRARETASYTARKLSMEVEILPFMREMTDVVVPSKIRDDLAIWHFPPKDIFNYTGQADWQEQKPFVDTMLNARLKEMETGTRELLKPYGVTPLAQGYAVEKDLSDEGDIAVFCHQGAGLTWIAHLLQVSYLDIWRTCYVSPTSLTTLLLEQSDEQFATFRMLGMGDISHLVRFGTEDRKTGLLYNRT